MGACGHVHRYTRDGAGEVGPEIEVEASQVVLIRLAFPAVLAHDHAWYGLQHFARTHSGEFGAAGDEVNSDAGKHGAGLIHDASRRDPRLLCAHRRGADEQDSKQDCGCS